MDPSNVPYASANVTSGAYPPLIEWAVAAAALPGQSTSGDRYVIKPHGDAVLIAVVDGLGHGEEAGAASEIAVATLQAHASDTVSSLFTACHQVLLHSRGVVMSLVQLSGRDHTLTWMGIGNVEGSLFRANPNALPARESIPSRGGIVGYQMPPAHPSSLPIAPGDMLVLVTDGIRGDFDHGRAFSDEPRQVAEEILRRSWRKTDDGLVLVARYRGGEW